MLVAREPRWMYAWWDLLPPPQRSYNARSEQGHLVVRVHSGSTAGQPPIEAPVHPESRHWFIHVDRAGTQYVAELGYYGPKRQWVTVAASMPATTPPETVLTDQTLLFATVPTQVPLSEIAALAKQTVPPDLAPSEAARERVLGELIAVHAEQPGGASSAELAGLVGGQAGVIPGAEVTLPALLAGGAADVSSPMGAAGPPPAGFWFSVNAELVIYGATEPDATVTIGGQPVTLRADGTFSCRYALPDGVHAVTVSAMSARGDRRQADLHFQPPHRPPRRSRHGTAGPVAHTPRRRRPMSHLVSKPRAR